MPAPSKFAFKKNPIIFIILFIAIVLTLATKGEGAFSFCLFYIFTGIFRSFKNLIFKKHKILKDITNEPLELKQTK